MDAAKGLAIANIMITDPADDIAISFSSSHLVTQVSTDKAYPLCQHNLKIPKGSVIGRTSKGADFGCVPSKVSPSRLLGKKINCFVCGTTWLGMGFNCYY